MIRVRTVDNKRRHQVETMYLLIMCQSTTIVRTLSKYIIETIINHQVVYTLAIHKYIYRHATFFGTRYCSRVKLIS